MFQIVKPAELANLQDRIGTEGSLGVIYQDQASGNPSIYNPTSGAMQSIGSGAIPPARDILLVGDSIVARNRYFADASTTGNYAIWSVGWWQYANAIMKSAFRLVACAGDSGLTIAQIAALLPTQAFPYSPQHAIVMAGANDIPLGDTGDVIFARYITQLVQPLLARGIQVGVCEFLPNGGTSNGMLTSAAKIAAYFRFNQLCREYVRVTPNTVLLPFTSKGYAQAADGYTPTAVFTTDNLHPGTYGALWVGKLVADVYSQFIRNDMLGARTTDPQNLANDPATPANSAQFASTNTASTTTGGWGAGATLTGGSTRPTGWTIYAQGSGMNIATSVVADSTTVPAGSDWLQIVISGTSTTTPLIEIDGGILTLASLGLAAGDWVEAFWEVSIASPVGFLGMSAALFFNGITGSGAAGATSPPVLRRFVKAFGSPFDQTPAGSANLDLTVLKSVDLPMFKIPAGTTGIRLHHETSLVIGANSGTYKVRNPTLRKVTPPAVAPPLGYAGSLFTVP